MAKYSTKRERKKTPRYVRLEHWLLDSLAWKVLKPSDRAVYIEVCKRYNGVNNGGIALSNRDAATLCNISKDTAGKCLVRLCDMGFLKIRSASAFSRKNRKATEYELTEYAYLDRTPTKDFMVWKPDAKKNNSPKRRTPRPKPRTPKGNITPFQVVGGRGL